MILRDPVHGLVSFEAEDHSIVEELLAAREVQRLRRIRQLGLTSFAYPGADHTRFSHALGVAHVMSRFIERMRHLHGDLPLHQRLNAERAEDVLAAALLHDLGHGPFSHLFEVAAPLGKSHEHWSERVILEEGTEVNAILRRRDPGLPGRVARLIRGEHELPYLARAVSGTFDVDRCDYLLRDAHFTGVSYGRFDLDWLLRSLRLSPDSADGRAPALAVDGQKGLPAIESFILARLFMFQQVYFHKASRASEWLLGRLLARLAEIVCNDGSGLRLPAGLSDILRNGETTLGQYLDLDDSNVWTALRELRDHKDPILRDLSDRLEHRRLFKSFELFGENASHEGRAECLAIAREVAEAKGFDANYYVGLDVPSVVAFEDQKDPIRVVFADGSQALPADVSFLLSRLSDQVVTRPRLIFAHELRDTLTNILHERRGAGTPGAQAGLAGGNLEARSPHRSGGAR